MSLFTRLARWKIIYCAEYFSRCDFVMAMIFAHLHSITFVPTASLHSGCYQITAEITQCEKSLQIENRPSWSCKWIQRKCNTTHRFHYKMFVMWICSLVCNNHATNWKLLHFIRYSGAIWFRLCFISIFEKEHVRNHYHFQINLFSFFLRFRRQIKSEREREENQNTSIYFIFCIVYTHGGFSLHSLRVWMIGIK